MTLDRDYKAPYKPRCGEPSLRGARNKAGTVQREENQKTNLG